MSTHDDDDLDLLLSLRVPETPPRNPTYGSDDDAAPPDASAADMSAFRDAVKAFLDQPATENVESSKNAPGKRKVKGEADVERFSGLRIRDMVLSQVEINSHFADVRFVRLKAIRNLLVDDNISGCWATVGVLMEKGHPRVSSNGKSFCIWKLGGLDESSVSVFLFGDAYKNNSHEIVGTVFALSNSSVRKDNNGNGFSLSIFSAGQINKLGISVDYGVCKGKRKDGVACTMVINKREGAYCKYHASSASQKYSTGRAELRGGNLRTAFRPPEGIYMVDPLKDRSSSKRPMQVMKVLSVEGLKKALSKSDKVTTQKQSQGIRFLTEVTANSKPYNMHRGSEVPSNIKSGTCKRPSTNVGEASTSIGKGLPLDAKRKKIHATQNVIELDFVSSDEEK